MRQTRQTILLLTLVGAVLLACSGVVLAQQAEERTTTTSGSEENESTASDENAPPKTPKKPIPDNYIVVLDEGADPDRVANEHARQHGAQLKFIYRNAIQGYAAVIPEGRRQAIERDSRVAYVEQDQVASITAQEDDDDQKESSEKTSGGKTSGGKPGGDDVSASGQTLDWGIDRIDADVSSTKANDGSGAISNVNAYIIDTGIYKHNDLNVVKHVNYAGGKNDDCHGHGTHVAGTVAAKDNTSDVVGAAPGAPLTGVKVLGCNGSGSYSGVIKGVDFVTGDAANKKPAIANMSLGGGPSKALDDAVRNSAASGVFYALAAGNDGADACEYSPARAGTDPDDGNPDTDEKNNGIMTVAATRKDEAETSWSNYGPCVDIWAPGANILSTKKGGGTTTMSGTSMASPHGAGGGALYLSTNTSASASPTSVESALKSNAQGTGTTSKDNTAIMREYVGGF